MHRILLDLQAGRGSAAGEMEEKREGGDGARTKGARRRERAIQMKGEKKEIVCEVWKEKRNIKKDWEEEEHRSG